MGTAAKRKWGCAAASLSGLVTPPARGGSCMDRGVLRGLLSLLPPPLHQVRPRMLNPESVPPSKRPRSRLMAAPRIGTHNGTFHCDEALACALLRLLPQYRDAEIVRTRDPKKLAACDIVVDVGGEYDPKRHRYDHHQRWVPRYLFFTSSILSAPMQPSVSAKGLPHPRQQTLVSPEAAALHPSSSPPALRPSTCPWTSLNPCICPGRPWLPVSP